MNNTPRELFEAIEESKVIALSGHLAPDGDALGAGCALAIALRNFGKEVIHIAEPFADKFLSIPGIDLTVREGIAEMECDLYIALDTATKGRLGIGLPLFEKAHKTINIDHHASNEGYGGLHYVDGDASSTSEMVFHLLQTWGLALTTEIATAIYTGILHDTGGFKHSCTHPSTMYVVAELIACGVPFTKIQEEQLYSHSFTELKMMGLALSRMERACAGALVYTYITLAEVHAMGGDIKELDGIVSQLKSSNGAHIAAFFYEKAEGEVKLSLRSDEAANVSDLAANFGGGGHMRAAGATILGTMEAAMNKVLPVLKEALGE